MRRKTHIFIGMIIAGGIYFGLDYIDVTLAFDNLVLGSLLCIMFSILPDVLEPAHSPKHRGALHSRGALKGMLIMCIAGFVLGYYYEEVYYLLMYLCAGYAGHLAADSTTPAGLPR